MQFRPDAAELLADIATLLEDKVIDAVTGPLQHQVRVAANLARIVERDVRLGAAAGSAERTRLAPFVPHDAGSTGPAATRPAATDLGATGLGDTAVLAVMRAELCDRLMGTAAIGDDEMRSIYDALVATVRDDLAISKPGYDSWAGV